jgi:uncharacterized protein
MSNNSADLVRASQEGDLDEVKALLRSGVDVNCQNEHGMGPLLTCEPSVIEYLLAEGADPSIQTNEYGASVLAGLCYVTNVKCVRILLEHDADPNLGRDETLETPMHHCLGGTHNPLGNAADGDVEEILRLLVNHGANVNAKTKPGIESCNYWGLYTRGETPLHRAAAWGTSEAIEVLLAAGAEPAIMDSNGETPYHWASWHKRDREIVERLKTSKL